MEPLEDLTLVKPSVGHLAAYTAALEQGWSLDNVRGVEAAREQLGKIGADPAGFVASLDNPDAKGEPIRLPDGSLVPRLPGFARWIWDGEFCGGISIRWQHGTSTLPSHVLGHIGFAVVPWKRGAGRAKQALALMLTEARRRDLDHVELTTDPGNIASQRVIQACGGTLVKRCYKAVVHGGSEALRSGSSCAAATTRTSAAGSRSFRSSDAAVQRAALQFDQPTVFRFVRIDWTLTNVYGLRVPRVGFRIESQPKLAVLPGTELPWRLKCQPDWPIKA